MKKILVLGVKGMAGHVIFRYLQNIKEYEVYGLARNVEPIPNIFNVDVSDAGEFEKILSENKFDIVINCIGILNQDAENNPEKAVWFNSYFPHYLEKITKSTSTKIIHISTDCVFNGKKGNYAESDFKDGYGFYAQSKALGELVNDKDITIRTSIIGPELNSNGIGLFHWFMQQTGETNGYLTAVWSGVTTIELAKAIRFAVDEKISGLVHLTNGIPINKFDLLLLFKEIWNRENVIILPFEGKIVDKSLQKSDIFRHDVPSYKEMLLEQKEWMNQYPELYNYN